MQKQDGNERSEEWTGAFGSCVRRWCGVGLGWEMRSGSVKLKLKCEVKLRRVGRRDGGSRLMR